MNDTMRHHEESQPDVFKNNDIPSRGLVSATLMLITNPVMFFSELGNRRSSSHTRWIAILILLILSITAVQTPANLSQPDMMGGGEMPFDSTPFDPGFPPDGGMIPNESTTNDPTARWTTVLTMIFKQVVQWGALTLLLSLVTLANGYMPPFGKNLEIAIWASVPLALMAGLQLAFISGGGTIAASGFSGFLDEWTTFATLNLTLQSVVHALAEQFTLFWLWGLWLLYVGMRFTLRGKLPIIVFTLVMWVTLSGIVSSLHSYEMLSSTVPTIEDITTEGAFPTDIMPDDNMPPMDMPDGSESNSQPDINPSIEQTEQVEIAREGN